jgi:hypothetical protein
MHLRRKTLEEADSGQGLSCYPSIDEMFKDMGF